MFTTETPGAQEFSIANNAATPPNDAPYPTEVGSAITGADTRPATTLGNAPSIPAATTITLRLPQQLQVPEDPVQPGHAHVDDQLCRPTQIPGGEERLPCHREVRRPGTDDHHQPTGRCRPLRRPGQQRRTAVVEGVRQFHAEAAACSAVARVNSVTPGRLRTEAAISRTWSGVLPWQ